jgi:putative transposase
LPADAGPNANSFSCQPNQASFDLQSLLSAITAEGDGRIREGIVRLTVQRYFSSILMHTSLMRFSVSLYHRHRFPAEIISHCVWLYFRFALSFRDVEEMLAMRGGSLSYETIREWCLKFGQTYVNGLRRKSSRATEPRTSPTEVSEQPRRESHQPTRLRERVMKRFKSAGHAQRFLSAFGIISSHFRVGRHLYSAGGYRTVRKRRLASWDEAIASIVPAQ